MKRIKKITWIVFAILLVCSCQKNQTTEIQLEDGTIYKINKTKDKEEVNQVFRNLKEAKFERNSFNGIEIKMNANAYGKLSIGKDSETNIEVKYDVSLNGKSNLKKYLFDGSIQLEGYTKTRSPSLSVDAKQKIVGNLKNDDSNLFLNGIYDSNDNRINIKKKLDIIGFTKEYKAMILSMCDILKYKKISEIIPELNLFIEEYATAITQTKKTSFTVQFTYLINQKPIDLFVEISSITLLPIHSTFHLDVILIEQLKKEYFEKYFTDLIDIHKASYKMEIDFSYGNYSIEELNETEKQEYSSIKNMPSII